MRAPREQLDLDEGETVARFQRFVERDGAASVRHGMVIDAHGVRFAVLAQEAFDAALRRLGAAEADAEVEFGQLAFADLFVQDAQRLGVFCRDDDAARVAVDAVAQRGSKDIFLARLPLALLVEIGKQMVDERIDLLPLVGVNDEPGWLVEQQNVLILVKDVQLWICDGEVDVLLARRFKELVVEVKLEPVALAQAVVALGAGSVDLDALEADVLLRQRGGQQGNGLEQKAVEPLISVIFLDGKLSHNAAPFTRKNTSRSFYDTHRQM